MTKGTVPMVHQKSIFYFQHTMILFRKYSLYYLFDIHFKLI
jgi:hypothetical protein